MTKPFYQHFFNGPFPASFRLFSSFQTNITIFTTNEFEKCPSSIQRWDSNPQPLEHESPPITTRLGLPPKAAKVSQVTRSSERLLRHTIMEP